MSTRRIDEIEQRRALLDAWVAKRRQIAQLEAEASALLADRQRLCEEDAQETPFHRDAIERAMHAEYAAAGRIAKGTIERAFADAAFLASSHAIVRESFQRGAITAAHAHEIIEAGHVVRQAISDGRADAETQLLYETAAVVTAEGDTPMRTRARVRQIAASLAGETIVETHRRAASERSVKVRSVGDGLALLQILLPEYLALAILDRLTQLSRQVIATRGDREPVLDSGVHDVHPDPIFAEDLGPDDPALDELDALDDHIIFGKDGTFALDPDLDVEHLPTDERTIDQVRADLATDLLLASDPSEANGTGLDGILARIQVTVAATTLAGADERPAELDGHGPIHPDIARDLAGRNGGWTRLFHDPSGMLTQTDTYSPTEGMRRFLRARDQHCRFPGCRMPVHRCQVDHNHDHAKGGRTEISNLGHFCTAHHVLKHPDVDERHRWSARQLPDGSFQWTSPLGRLYIDPPPRRVMFV
ncbi:HNH endonuclease signature motif containing protein [Microbacterium hydrocarbonoxydans]|uniref:HNH endonuclease signature motif containing protein n=1 Tax=Microbacterium hydrocarbonoxydans TaxID=273678 RepID=UPI0007BC3BDD|nr:HNH endonuclease signature motif containing protein [Microbacterium hydrocarbonoxydans]GAT71596.1 HNH endonuclease [Microbacterium sp. HM58-2]